MGESPGMATWRIDRRRPVETTRERDTAYAYSLIVASDKGDEAQMTIEWIEKPTQPDLEAEIVWGRYRQDMLGESEWPARRVVVDNEGGIRVVEPGSFVPRRD